MGNGSGSEGDLIELSVEMLEDLGRDEVKELAKQLLTTLKAMHASNEELKQLLSQRDAELADLRRVVFGHKSERTVSVDRQVRARKKKTAEGKAAALAQARQRRRENAQAKQTNLESEDIHHSVQAELLCCPICGGTKFEDLGKGEISDEYEYVPARLMRKRHIRQKMVCCGCHQHIVTAECPVRVADKVLYGPGFHAHVAVSKCSDSIPLTRQAKQLRRSEVVICRSTLCDIFQRDAALLRSLYRRMLELIALSQYVNADETPVPVLDKEKKKTRKAYMWTFIIEQIVAYVYSPSRSGQTPLAVLGESQGYLQADDYSGYNQVTKPDRRIRIGCWGHLRRYFWKSMDDSPEESKHLLDEVVLLYEVEYEALEQGVLGTEVHLAMRKEKSAPVVARIKQWLDTQQPRQAPKSKLGKAIGYALSNWTEMTRFLADPKIKLDNNISERQLRLIALGRKNFLFVGNDEAGESLAILQSLTSSCELNGVDPQQYLTDVLIRIQTHPQSQIDELLPHNWQPPARSPPPST